MPYLQFDTTLALSADEKSAFADRVTELISTEMATAAARVAVSIRTRTPAELHLGRATEGPLLFLDADVHRGQSVEHRRAFALALADYAGDEFAVPEENVTVVFTEHPDENVMGGDTVGGDAERREE